MDDVFPVRQSSILLDAPYKRQRHREEQKMQYHYDASRLTSDDQTHGDEEEEESSSSRLSRRGKIQMVTKQQNNAQLN
ncbi:hypothetical protein FisN_36Lu003 [Fistulifera solaris]|uniref:Uncharacterized protein n=1 Tax=Fistulifera solaris TaxID=1519565 RepID=A0A1Z5JHH1_FISSO|nr:hypothetical protein FisN_36Lu003 [Fistulifera solaris]|eukprot:GAX13453.1 hypothetical protein FisN_36Lu003 [Fistulifera solaris]